MMRMNPRGLAILKHYEQGPQGGPALYAYRCPAGKWTISWGVTEGVTAGMCITPANAEKMLVDAIAPREAALNKLVQGAPTNANQFSAMLLLLYNIGADNFAGSTVLRKHRAQDYAGAAAAFASWNKAHVNSELVVLKGLTTRRAEEASLYASTVL